MYVWSCNCIQENLDKFIEITSGWGTKLGVRKLKGIFVFLCLEFSFTMKIECIHVLLVKVKTNLKRMEESNRALSSLARNINRVDWRIVCVMNGIFQGTKQEDSSSFPSCPSGVDCWIHKSHASLLARWPQQFILKHMVPHTTIPPLQNEEYTHPGTMIVGTK